MAEFSASGGGVPSNVPRVIVDSVNVGPFSNTSFELKKTYSDLSFTAGKIFKITVIGGGSTGTLRINIRLWNGTNETDLTTTSVIDILTGNLDGCIQLYLMSNTSTTAQLVSAGNMSQGATTVAQCVAGNGSPVTLGGSSTWTQQHTIRIYALRGSADMTIKKVIIEELTS